MSRILNGLYKKAGLSPGKLVYIGEKRDTIPKIHFIDYSDSELNEGELKNPEESAKLKEKKTTTWLNINGIHNVDIIDRIGKVFGFHPLILEDVVNTMQRPKLEDFEKYIFIVLKMIYYDSKDELQIEQVSLVLGKGFLITFQEREGDIFEPIRQRIKTSKGFIRKRGPDYLAYAIIDAVIDNYFVVIEKVGEEIEELEQKLMHDPSSETLNSLHILKRKLISLRRSIWPLREVASKLYKSESKLINKTTKTYLTDIYGNAVHIIDTIETYREMVSGMLDVYLSGISNRMNEVMKVLTMIATVFIPLTFIAGVYGMNFHFMPELEHRLAYPIVMLIMFMIALIMVFYFKKKKWL